MKKVLTGILTFSPAILLAADSDFSNINSFVSSLGKVINNLLPIVVALALLYFFWGLARFILAAGDEDSKENGKRIMIWGVVALFVMVSVWGIVNFMRDIFGVENNNAPNIDVPEVRDDNIFDFFDDF
ncbi:MAG: pilin [Candidatus Pacebacteria bacterium]|nr:pilin [Candidatus Paceibacterota bacterium]